MRSAVPVFRTPRGRTLALLAAGLVASSGCALRSAPDTREIHEPPSTTTRARVEGEPTAATRGANDFVEVDTGGRGLLLVRPDHQLGRYDALMIEHVGFRYGSGQRWLSLREEDRINAMLTESVLGDRDGGIGHADESGPCVLGVRFYVTDLELLMPASDTGSTTSFVHSFGQATMTLELRDTETNLPIAYFLQRRDLGGGPAYGLIGASIRRLGTVVDVAMRDMGRQLQRLTPPTARGWDAQCNGGMTRVAFGAH